MYMILEEIIKVLDRGLSGIIIGAIIGFLTSHYFKDRTELSYQTVSFPLNITQDYLSDKKNLRKFVKTIYIVWNSGNQVITHDDITSAEPLRLTSKMNSIMLLRTLKISKISNEVHLPFKLHEVLIDFKFLTPGDGFVFEVIHHREDTLSLDGQIVGMKKRIKHNGGINMANGRRGLQTSFILMTASIFGINIMYIITGVVAPVMGSVVVMYLFSIIGIILSIFLFKLSLKEFPSNLKIKEIGEYIMRLRK
ncbi:hypothetical protein [Paenibacillus xylanexedens]|uniref:hypothetical protein n=1 Tax=Paenibacillus xylanexedens TaxID=528191 RepID=UPI0011A51DBB|nr:hypothetical protein [Paenibacillus xylanexedens]